MTIVYAHEPIPEVINKSIFLAGPSLRPGQEDEISWRALALQILSNMDYDGVVFVPESREGKFDDMSDVSKYAAQLEWEEQCLNVADVIIFWMNRSISENRLGLTSNDEFGVWKYSGKVIFGAPDNADKVRYQSYYSQKLNIPEFNNIYLILSYAINKLNNGIPRTGGERYVPIEVFETPMFQQWYESHLNAGNRLDEAKVLHTYRAKNGYMFAYTLWCKIWIEAEQRFKDNEFVFTRPDISACVMFYRPENCNSILDIEVVLVKEFRSPVRNSTGFIYELPGGSSTSKDKDELDTMIAEVSEETGYLINRSRVNELQSRQLASTLLTHHAHIYSVELNSNEMELMKNKRNQIFGNILETEMTYVEVFTVKQILDSNLVDWSNIGMIMASLQYQF